MPSLQQDLSDFFGRAVIVARGADEFRAAAERALASGDGSLALQHAREVLARVPRSPLGLLLAAEAAERSFLDEQAAQYLAELVDVVPWSAEAWLRLGLARLRAGLGEAEVREALGRAAVDLSAPVIAARAAVVLADLDLDSGDPTRALAWLDRVKDVPDPLVLERRATALLDLGEIDAAREAASTLDAPGPLDSRRLLLFGRLAAQAGQDATPLLLRACILEQKGAARALASYLATGGPEVVEAVTDVLRALGELESPLFRAALAQAQGDRRGSLDALGAAADTGDVEAARALGALAVEARDVDALARAHRALEAAGGTRPAVELAIVAGAARLAGGDLKGALDALEVAGEQPWAAALRAEVMGRWVPAVGLSDVPGVLGELRRAARALDDARALLATESLAVEAERPLRVAIMGEFNAGKSTFVNALLGAEIAPTGVLPTTATLHHVVFSPDPFARIVLAKGPERVVPPDRLRAALSEVHAAGAVVQRVTVGYPLERLRHIEIIDTPGFNAPNTDHAASAREALAEVHIVIWLMDASQPWKESERAILGEVRAVGVPAQVVVNKLDRVPEAERPRVLAYVGEKLAETGLVSLMPFIWASSRQALAGRLGDESALSLSNWSAVEGVVGEIVSQAPALRDAALRRRARELLGPLLERARGMAAAEVESARAESETRASLVQAAAWLAREQAAAARAVARALDVPRRALIDDLAPLGQGDAAASRSYAAQRTAQRLAGPVAAALAQVATPIEAHRQAAIDASLPAIEAALHGLVCGLPKPAEVGDLSIDRLLEATLLPARGALERESARGVASRAGAAAALVLRCAALETALRGAA